MLQWSDDLTDAGKEAVSLNLRTVSHERNVYYSPHFSMNDTDSLRFISCGVKSLSQLAFYELVKVFDLQIWIGYFYPSFLSQFS